MFWGKNDVPKVPYGSYAPDITTYYPDSEPTSLCSFSF